MKIRVETVPRGSTIAPRGAVFLASRRTHSGGGRSGFVVTWEGTLQPCNRLDMVRAYPLKEGFREAWAKVHREVMNWPRVPECDGCAYRGVCTNCAATMLQYAEPGKQPVEMCERVRNFVRHGIMHIPECD